MTEHTWVDISPTAANLGATRICSRCQVFNSWIQIHERNVRNGYDQNPWLSWDCDMVIIWRVLSE